jgi:hypothetical protein
MIFGLKTMKNNVAFIIAIILSLFSITPALADIAPPEPPPGSGISPSQETQVQMVAENVLMVVKETSADVYIIEVNAYFVMRNLGAIDEQMQVRFPLENISGIGDGWGEHPEVRNFQARVNQSQVPTKIIQEPYQSNGIPLSWAAFNVNFPTGRDVYVRVSYVTDVQNSESPVIQYILGTGAGWYESIGTATITVRFPYAVSMANILWFQEPEKITENVALIGKEIRWHWKNYEPTRDEIIGVTVVHPRDWQSILDLEAKTGINPDDIDSVIELSRKYQRAGSNKEYISTPILADLAEIAIEQALALHPNDIRLHLELAEIYQQRYWFSRFSPENPYTQKLQDEIGVILELEPTNQRSLELKTYLEQDLAKSQPPTLPPALTKTVITKIPTQKPSQTPFPTLTVTITPGVAMEGSNSRMQVFTWVFLLITGFVFGTIFAKKRQKLL